MEPVQGHATKKWQCQSVRLGFISLQREILNHHMRWWGVLKIATTHCLRGPLIKPGVLGNSHPVPFCTFQEKKQGGPRNWASGKNYRDNEEAFVPCLHILLLSDLFSQPENTMKK